MSRLEDFEINEINSHNAQFKVRQVGNCLQNSPMFSIGPSFWLRTTGGTRVFTPFGVLSHVM